FPRPRCARVPILSMAMEFVARCHRANAGADRGEHKRKDRSPRDGEFACKGRSGLAGKRKRLVNAIPPQELRNRRVTHHGNGVLRLFPMMPATVVERQRVDIFRTSGKTRTCRSSVKSRRK